MALDINAVGVTVAGIISRPRNSIIILACLKFEIAFIRIFNTLEKKKS